MPPDERRSSLVGRQLGGYQVLAPIGAGGMGEVYRARDTTLARDVAIKVLPSAVTADPDRLERFEREARLLASLNHPNIAHVYGFVKDPSTGSGHTVPALIMELVEGPTLLDRIAKGPIPFDEALIIAKQLASALDAAHERGVVHRDLKPANIKVRGDGTVKVLDFGLAKAIGGELAADLSHVPTLTAAGTFAGVVLGTPAYMSPEQARGHAVDKRTDIWAFGCVLCEMLTGRPAFARDTVSDTIAAVLEREPDLQQLPATAGSIRRLLQLCLEKDARNRLRDIGDAMALVDAGRSAASTPGPRTRERWLMAISAAAVVLLAAFAAWTLSRPAAASPERVHFTVPAPDGQRIAPGDAAAGAIAVSPDGRQIAFVAGPSGDRSMI